ncbi:glycosyltransferase [Apilactobacillus nanyangensis]|uniref:glycosyltransferase n=1 Tax=Apilactobacillus nanyangensis TaxID=2799579 RepID=UPI0019434F70|nr:glycosyltransferase [Apilactobacillus nanyangensis]
MKKGLLLIPYLKGYGGTETVINNLLNEFDKEECEIELSIYSVGGTDQDDWLKHKNVNIINYPKNRYFREFLYILTLPFIITWCILKNSPEFIISTNPIMWFVAKMISTFFRKNVKIVAWYHYSYRLKPVRKIFLNSADKYFVISRSGRDELLENNIKDEDISIIYNPVIPTNKIIKHSDSKNVFVYVGRTEYKNQKNISELFYGLSGLSSKNWMLINYGVGPDKESLVKLSEKLGIEKNIRWMGFQINVFDQIKKADALVLSSKYEGLPMVLLEGISHGLFSISSNCPTGPSEVINKDNGLLYKCGDVDELTDCLEKVINNDFRVDYDTIKKSINKFYVDQYMERFLKALRNI